MKKWEKLLNKAFSARYQAEGLLDEAVVELMKSKGFSEEIALKFRACFASGTETVISFNYEGELADLDVGVANSMNKEEIIERLSEHLSDNSIKLINS